MFNLILQLAKLPAYKLAGLIAFVHTVMKLWKKYKQSVVVKARKRILITGAAQGLGKAAALYLAKTGDFVIVADVDRQGIENTADEIKRNGGEALALHFDVRDEKQVQDAAHVCQQKIGCDQPLDAIANVAGVIKGGPLVEMTAQDFNLVMDVNVKGIYNVTKAFFPLLERSKTQRPRIINIASEVSWAQLSAGFSCPYSMSKFAVEAYSTGLRQELSTLQERVDVVVVNPGAMGTKLVFDQLNPETSYHYQHAVNNPDTLFKHQLSQGAKLAVGYMKKNHVDPQIFGEAIYKALHSRDPIDRVLVNVSYEMMLASITPQFVLDAATRYQLC